MLTGKWIWLTCEGKADLHKNVIYGKKNPDMMHLQLTLEMPPLSADPAVFLPH